MSHNALPASKRAQTLGAESTVNQRVPWPTCRLSTPILFSCSSWGAGSSPSTHVPPEPPNQLPLSLIGPCEWDPDGKPGSLQDQKLRQEAAFSASGPTGDCAASQGPGPLARTFRYSGFLSPPRCLMLSLIT